MTSKIEPTEIDQSL